MDDRATGLILRTYLLSETSLIVHWLTQDFGRLATVAKGARRPKSPFRGKLDLYFLADFSFRRSRRSTLHTLCELELRHTHDALRRDLAWFHQAAYAASLIEQTTETDTPLPDVFEMLLTFIQSLPASPGSSHTLWAFEIKLLDLLGLAPNLASPSHGLSAEGKRILEHYRAHSWDDARRAPAATEEHLQRMSRFLAERLADHLGKFPRGRTDALDVLE